jgi:hypothetical protein
MRKCKEHILSEKKYELARNVPVTHLLSSGFSWHEMEQLMPQHPSTTLSPKLLHHNH